MALPPGVSLTGLNVHRDERGWLTELFRNNWEAAPDACQWNASLSEPNVLRGVHVHHRHHDYLVVLQGRLSIGLYDARPQSPTFRAGQLVELAGEQPTAITIPPGVLHGFYAHQTTLYTYAVDSYYDPDDEIGCHWTDPGLGIAWPCRHPMLSERDDAAGPLAVLEARLEAIGAELC
jgi:dTDP-4-dehydrorhamnose 3,5-epimerase